MSTTANKYAPSLFRNPRFEGEVAAYASPFDPKVILVDRASLDKGTLRWGAVDCDSKMAMTAIRARSAMRKQMGESVTAGGASIPVFLAVHIAVNEACRALVANATESLIGADSTMAMPSEIAEQAAERIAGILNLDQSVAIEQLVSTNHLPCSPDLESILIAMDHISERYVVDSESRSADFPGFLLSAYHGARSPDHVTLFTELVLAEPELFGRLKSVPDLTFHAAQAIASNLHTDGDGFYTTNKAFIKAGQHKATVLAGLQGFITGDGMHQNIARAGLYEESADGNVTPIFENTLLSPAQMKTVIAQYRLTSFETAMDPEGFIPLISTAQEDQTSVYLAIDLIDGKYPTGDLFTKIADSNSIVCNQDEVNQIGLADHVSASAAPRLG
ncbi:hypothetical protein LCGC14_0328300 [marine sediment metagenome]|uniref:Uncharacterized protein n=1 Tax=marine sediment metagenome TaxID=412755 RepID=A0A0F9W4M4_9ZZZZ